MCQIVWNNKSGQTESNCCCTEGCPAVTCTLTVYPDVCEATQTLRKSDTTSNSTPNTKPGSIRITKSPSGPVQPSLLKFRIPPFFFFFFAFLFPSLPSFLFPPSDSESWLDPSFLGTLEVGISHLQTRHTRGMSPVFTNTSTKIEQRFRRSPCGFPNGLSNS